MTDNGLNKIDKITDSLTKQYPQFYDHTTYRELLITWNINKPH